MIGYSVISMSVAVIAGLSCGFLNVVASSGSAVSLPALVWIGLYAVDANATNRIPVLIASLTATITLARQGKIPWGVPMRATPPGGIGPLWSTHESRPPVVVICRLGPSWRQTIIWTM